MTKVCEQISRNVNILAFENMIKRYNFFKAEIHMTVFRSHGQIVRVGNQCGTNIFSESEPRVEKIVFLRWCRLRQSNVSEGLDRFNNFISQNLILL